MSLIVDGLDEMLKTLQVMTTNEKVYPEVDLSKYKEVDTSMYPDVTYPIQLDRKGFQELEEMYRRISKNTPEDNPWIPTSYKMPPDEQEVQYAGNHGAAHYTGHGWCGVHGWCGRKNDGTEYYITDRVYSWRPIIRLT